MPRKRVFKEPLVRTSVSLPTSYYEAVVGAGEGVFSRGVRVLHDSVPVSAESLVIPAIAQYNEVLRIGDGDYRKGLSILLESYAQAAG